jgi:hypothetical protein
MTPRKVMYNLWGQTSYCIICVKCFNTKQNYFNYNFQYLKCSVPKELKPTDLVIFLNNRNLFIPFWHECKHSVTVGITLLRLEPFTKSLFNYRIILESIKMGWKNQNAREFWWSLTIFQWSKRDNLLCNVCLFSWCYNALWLYFHSPVAGFSLLVFEVSWSHKTTLHSR